MEVQDIAFVTVSMSGGGTERVISILSNYYVKKGINVHIYMIAGSDVAYKLDERVSVIQVSSPTGGSLGGRISRIRKLRKLIRPNEKTLVIAMGTVTSMFTCLAMIGLHNHLVISERNDPNRLNHRPIKMVEKILRNVLYIRANKVVFQTEMAKNQFPRYIKKKSTIIGNPLDDVYKNLKQEKKEKVILAAGRLTEQKNYQLLIQAYSELCSQSEFVLKIFGDGELKSELQNMIDELRLRDKIKLCGFSDSLIDEMNRSEIYVSTSNWEGVSNTLMEAMACGMAVIATDCPMGGSAMLIKDSINGKLIPVDDKEALVSCLNELTLSSDKRAELGRNASKICEELNVASIAKKWVMLNT